MGQLKRKWLRQGLEDIVLKYVQVKRRETQGTSSILEVHILKYLNDKFDSESRNLEKDRQKGIPIVRILDTFSAEHGIVLAMPAYPCTFHYFKQLARMPDETLMEICKSLLGALDFVHSHGVAHLDLNPNNVLVKPLTTGSFVLSLSDFGLAVFVSQKPSITGFRGTPDWVAPEIAQFQVVKDSAPYGPIPADLWACGKLLSAVINLPQEDVPPLQSHWVHLHVIQNIIVGGLMHHSPAMRLAACNARNYLSATWSHVQSPTFRKLVKELRISTVVHQGLTKNDSSVEAAAGWTRLLNNVMDFSHQTGVVQDRTSGKKLRSHILSARHPFPSFHD